MKLHTVLFLIIIGSTIAFGQSRDYRVHTRGMLHETIYNTGEIGRAYDQGAGGSTLGVPSFEWPGNSSAEIDGKEYNGQYNSFGGGLYLSTSRRNSPNRYYAWCGAIVGEPTTGRYSFPISLDRIENYPVLANGELNPSYNPDEAEEVIISRWATNVGITVTRTSRAWSDPDYDDMIIYEYELENTGVTNSSGTPTFQDTIWDALVGFAYALNPSMFGYERTFNRWDGADFTSRDLYPRFNVNRWLNYCVDLNGKPEPHYFDQWASTGKNGGGLLSPQAVGYFPLYYDSAHLAKAGETKMQIPSNDTAVVMDGNGHLKQPYLNRMETGNLAASKIEPYLDVSVTRKNNPYRSALYPFRSPYWYGRGSYNWRQSEKFGIGHILVFGPYTLPPGAKVHFSIAQVAGYGASRYGSGTDTVKLWDEGGSCGELCGEGSDVAANAFNPVPSWYKPITYGGINHTAWTQGSNYLSQHPLPEYVNSNVVTIREVADRAIQLYTGRALKKFEGYADSMQYKPEIAPTHGIYKFAPRYPAPAFTVETDTLARNFILWGRQVEDFTAPGLQSTFDHYEIYRADHPLGPWKMLDSVGRGDPRYFENEKYVLMDSSTHEGEAFYYSIVAMDGTGRKSARSQIVLHQTRMPGVSEMTDVYVVPNPFIVRSGFGGVTGHEGDASQKIGFYRLPKKCTIRVISYAGQLIEAINHDSGFYSTEYLRITRNNQMMASGVYFYVVETPDGKRTHGKFVIIN